MSNHKFPRTFSFNFTMILTKLGGWQILILQRKPCYLKKKDIALLYDTKNVHILSLKLLWKLSIEFNSCMWKEVVFVFWELHDPVRFYKPNTLERKN